MPSLLPSDLYGGVYQGIVSAPLQDRARRQQIMASEAEMLAAKKQQQQEQDAFKARQTAAGSLPAPLQGLFQYDPKTALDMQAAAQEADKSKQWGEALGGFFGEQNAFGPKPLPQQNPFFQQLLAQDPARAKTVAELYTPEKPNLPTSVQEFQYAQENPAFQAYQEALADKRGNKTTVTVGGDSGPDAKLREKLSEDEGKRWSEILGAAQNAASINQDMELLEEISKMAIQGPILGRVAEAFPEFTTAGAAFEAITKRVAPSLRSPGSGSTSDIEYEGFLKGLPRLRNLPDANRIIASTMKSKAQLDVARGRVISDYQNQRITASEARDQLQALNSKSILSPTVKQILGTGGGVAQVGRGTVVESGGKKYRVIDDEGNLEAL